MDIQFEINKANALPIKAEIRTEAQMLIVANPEVIFEI